MNSSAHQMSAGASMTGDAMSGMEMARAGHVSITSKLVVTLITVAMLGVGFAVAARFGDLSMRARDPHMMQMPQSQ